MKLYIILGVLCIACALKPEDVDPANWMGELRPMIGDKRLGDIIIPATHDSGTCGINEDSHVVDRNFLFELGDLVTPDVLVNWSLTQDQNILAQLEAGYRAYDMRIADVEIFNDTFRWWHGLTGDEIFGDLEDIHNFATEHEEEVIFLHFRHFAAPALAAGGGTRDIPQRRKDEIADILLDYLGPVLVPFGSVSENPTLNEVLATGNNVIALMDDTYIRGQSNLFWQPVIHSAWAGRTNPEDLFEERSSKLADFKDRYSHRMTLIDGCATPDETPIAAAMIRVYGDNPIIKEILERLLPGVAALEPDLMSFEGVYIDLHTQAALGTNEGGMHVRKPENYTNGASVQYMGLNYQWEYWIARPAVYKANMINVDAFSHSSAVITAIRANMDLIPREASISFQGNSRDGFYYWDTYQAYGGAEGNECENIAVRITIIDDDEVIDQWIVDAKWNVQLKDGEYSTHARVLIEVEMPSGEWGLLHEENIQTMIETSQDLYVRGSAIEGFRGFAYVSTLYNLFGEDCITPPDGNYIALLQW